MVFTVSHVNQLQERCDAQLRLAVTVAFAVTTSADDPSEVPPLMLMRLTRSRITGLFGVAGHHLAGDDPVARVAALTPKQCGPDPDDDHLGSLAATNLWTPAGLSSRAEPGRIIVGVTASGWSLAIRERWDSVAQTCQVAEPSEFGKVGDELADALSTLNYKFSLLGT